MLGRAKVLAKEGIEEPQDEKEEAGEEEVEQEASQVPASDDQVSPEAHPQASKNAHFQSHTSQQICILEVRVLNVLKDTHHKDELSYKTKQTYNSHTP